MTACLLPLPDELTDAVILSHLTLAQARRIQDELLLVDTPLTMAELALRISHREDPLAERLWLIDMDTTGMVLQ
jgi:hypothetical protein